MLLANNMKYHLYLLFDTCDESLAKAAVDKLCLYCDLSCSPFLEKDGALIMNATFSCEQEQFSSLLAWMNNDWDEDEGFYSAYSFNTKMFDPIVYYAQVEAI